MFWCLMLIRKIVVMCAWQKMLDAVSIPNYQDISNTAAHHPHTINIDTARNMTVEHVCLSYCADEGDPVVEMILKDHHILQSL